LLGDSQGRIEFCVCGGCKPGGVFEQACDGAAATGIAWSSSEAVILHVSFLQSISCRRMPTRPSVPDVTME
jgi:hypothetical protein